MTELKESPIDMLERMVFAIRDNQNMVVCNDCDMKDDCNTAIELEMNDYSMYEMGCRDGTHKQ